MGSLVTVTWTDPVVGLGQAALASLNVFAAVKNEDGSAGPLVLLDSVAPGVQTYTAPAGKLASGGSFYFTVKATDVNAQQSVQGNWGGPLGPIGAPSPPTDVSATLG